MSDNKKSFVLYCELIQSVKKLTDQQAGKLFKIILMYVNDENPVVDNLILDLVFEPIKQQLKRDLKRWENIQQIRAESGRKGGKKSGEIRGDRSKNEANEANASFSEANEAVNVNEDVNVNVINTPLPPKGIDWKILFENFRKIFPGIKRGLDIEFQNFIKKNKPEIVDLLLPALEKEIHHKESLKLQNGFCPEWKNLSTWINQKCWTQELPEIIPKTNGHSVKYLSWAEMEKKCSANFPQSNFEMVNTPDGKRWILKQPQTQN